MDVPKNWKRMPGHPLALMVPRPTEVEQMALVGDMRDRGYDKKQPIVIADDTILDGLCRRDAAIEAGVLPTFEEYKSNDLSGFVTSRNVHRRHMTTSQRAIFAADLIRYESVGNGSAEISAEQSPKKTIADRAAEMNVSADSVKEAAAVIEHAHPDVAQAVRDGAISVADAGAIKDEPPARQRKAVERVRKGEASTAREAIGKHAGKATADKAAKRIAKQQGQKPASGMVTCPKCRGKGEITEAQAKAMAFVPPTVKEVEAYCKDIKADNVNAEAFVDHYESNGWMIGKAKMKDWKAAVRKWKVSSYNSGGANGKRKLRGEYDPKRHG